jgi:hypothetical protein
MFADLASTSDVSCLAGGEIRALGAFRAVFVG